MIRAARGKSAVTAGAEEASAAPPSVRDRILATARELFYREGVRAVGVDTVVAQSGVAKTSLYRWFPSKDALIAAVLEEEAKDRWTGWDRILQRSESDEPRARLLAQMSGIVKYVDSSSYRGCPFMNASVEFPDPQHPARQIALRVCEDLDRRLRVLIDAIPGVRDPQQLTDQLAVLIEGALASAQVRGKNGPQRQLLAASEALIDAQLK